MMRDNMKFLAIVCGFALFVFFSIFVIVYFDSMSPFHLPVGTQIEVKNLKLVGVVSRSRGEWIWIIYKDDRGEAHELEIKRELIVERDAQ